MFFYAGPVLECEDTGVLLEHSLRYRSVLLEQSPRWGEVRGGNGGPGMVQTGRAYVLV